MNELDRQLAVALSVFVFAACVILFVLHLCSQQPEREFDILQFRGDGTTKVYRAKSINRKGHGISFKDIETGEWRIVTDCEVVESK